MSANNKQGKDEVDITKVTPQQLENLGKAIQEELQQLSQSYNQLQLGVRKFQESSEVLNYLKEYGSDKEVMVPLTSSLYVPGVMEDTNAVLVEVGASYFIEQTNQNAQEYCQRKKEMLAGNAKKVNEILSIKKIQMQKVQNQLQMRMAAYQQ